LGDLKVHVGNNAGVWKGMIGQYGDGINNISNSGKLLPLSFNKTPKALCIKKLYSKQKLHRLHTWCRESSGQRSLIDSCIASGDLFQLVLNFRVKRDAELSINRHLVIYNVSLEIPTWRIRTCRASRSLSEVGAEALVDLDVVCRQRIVLASRDPTMHIASRWPVAVVQTSSRFLGCSGMSAGTTRMRQMT